MKIKKIKMEKRGFTVIELMVVIVILGILASVTMPKIFSNIERAKVTAAKIQIKNFEVALKLFYLDNGFYPDTEQGLQSLVEKPTTGQIPLQWRERGYLDKMEIPMDTWGGEYLYLSPGRAGEEYEIFSYGKDMKEGGEDSNADISSSKL